MKNPLAKMGEKSLSAAVLSAGLLSILSLLGASSALAAPACIGSLSLNKATPVTQAARLTQAVTTAVEASTLLDFDGDGLSDIASTRQTDSQTIFDIRFSRDASSKSISLPRGRPVPADYDGDGVWDAAVVRKSSRGIVWTLKLSSSAELVSRTLGSAQASVVSGCRLLSAGRYSLAAIEGRKLKAIEFGSAKKRSITFSGLARTSPLGCGDASGDGIDELLLLIPTSDIFINGVSSVSCVNDFVDYGTGGSGTNLSIFNSAAATIPAVVRERFRSELTKLLRLSSLYDRANYPHFYIPRSAQYTFGKYSTLSDLKGLGLLWLEAGSNKLFRQPFSAPKTVESLGSLAAGSRLLASQAAIENGEIPAD